MRSSLLLAWMCAALSVASQAQSAETARFQLTEDPSEVLDVQAKLVWKRCVEGMTWSGGTCQGKALMLDHVQAQAVAKTAFEATRLPWRLPHVTELKRLIDPTHSNPAIDAVLFPHTPAQWHWSASASVGGSGTFNPYNYGNIAQGRTPSSVNQMAFLHGWAVNFSNGESRGEVLKRTPMVIRLVRGAR